MKSQTLLKKAGHLIISMLLFALILPPAVLSARAEDADLSDNPAITVAKTPVDTKTSGAAWLRSFSDQKIAYNSTPVFYNGLLYIVNGNMLYECNTSDGSVLRTVSLSASMDSVCYMICHGDFLYLPLTGGCIQCIRLTDMKPVWTSESFGGQSLSHVTYADGKLYAGATTKPSGAPTAGIFYCLDATDGHTVWTYENTGNPGGYYWSGSVVYQNYVYFTGDNGTLICHSKDTDEVIQSYTLTTSGKIRSNIFMDAETSSFYTASTDGKIHRFQIDVDGSCQNFVSADINGCTPTSVNCTSTPVVYNGRLYIGSMADGKGLFSVLDADTLEPVYHVTTGTYREVKATPLVAAGTSSTDKTGPVTVYFTCNALPGALYYIQDAPGQTSAQIQTLFTPAQKQYCISSVYAGPDGTLYYSNDSGYLFAVREGVVTDNGSTDSDSNNNAGQESVRPKAPVIRSCRKVAKKSVQKKALRKNGILTKKKQKKYQVYELKFKKNDNHAKTSLESKTGSGKWKKISSDISSPYVFVIKKGQKTLIRIRNCSTAKNGKKIYSSYVKPSRKL